MQNGAREPGAVSSGILLFRAALRHGTASGNEESSRKQENADNQTNIFLIATLIFNNSIP
ncbi:hypothetical protein [Herbaspirillum robiniae]|uniref:hypothetical protein n=1 Tax=Herbaspirillum robiniae TaxID=2014887 RepID=UPI003D77F7BE